MDEQLVLLLEDCLQRGNYPNVILERLGAVVAHLFGLSEQAGLDKPLHM